MGEISTKANQVYRDKDGGSPHYPIKHEIRDLFALVDGQVDDLMDILVAARDAHGDAALAGALAGTSAAQEVLTGKLDINGGNAASMIGLNFDDPTAPLRRIGPPDAAPPNGIYMGSGSINLSLDTFISSPIGAADNDNQRAMLALVARTSDDGNSEEQTLLVMTRIQTGFSKTWATSTAFSVGDNVSFGGARNTVYRCITAGVSAASGTGPTGQGQDIIDGTVHWRWINDAAINSKTGSYFETVIVQGAGSSWGLTNNVHVEYGCNSPFIVGLEQDLTNNSGYDSVFGSYEKLGHWIALQGANRSTAALQISSANTDNDAAIWALHFAGDRLASNSIIAMDASAPIGIGAGVGAGGAVTPKFSTAFIRDKSDTPVGLWLAGTNYTNTAIAITQNAPSGIAISAANTIASYLALASGPTGFLGSAANDVANFTANGTTPSGYLAAGANSSAAFSATGSGGPGLGISGVRNLSGIFEDSTAPYGAVLSGVYAFSPILFETLPPAYANDAAAAAGGLVVGAMYRTGSNLMLRAA